jgi:hypothetical protein
MVRKARKGRKVMTEMTGLMAKTEILDRRVCKDLQARTEPMALTELMALTEQMVWTESLVGTSMGTVSEIYRPKTSISISLWM